MKTLVLGAGIAGLTYINNLKSDDEVYLYEKSSELGGLCKSFNIKGFTFDSAVHLSFTNNETVRSQFDECAYIKHFPISYNYYKHRWLKHPIVNNMYPLNVDEKCLFIESFVNREENRQINNYEDWLLASYGEEFVDKFYNVYTRKYWTTESNEMSTTWIDQRLTTPDLGKVLYGAFEKETGNDYYAKEMRYPQCGGYENFIKSYMQKANIFTDKEIISVNINQREVHFADGTVEGYDRLVSSIPICEMPFIIQDSPEDVKSAAKRLKYTKISIVSVGFSKPDVPKYLWMYVYDEDIKTARINSPSIKSSNNAPEGCSSMQFEIYHRNDEEIIPEDIVNNVKYSISKMEICDEDDIMFMDYRLLPYGNVIFYSGMEDDRKIVKDYLESVGIELIGRFGEWDYLWSDQSFMSGYNMAKKHSSEEE